RPITSAISSARLRMPGRYAGRRAVGTAPLGEPSRRDATRAAAWRPHMQPSTANPTAAKVAVNDSLANSNVASTSIEHGASVPSAVATIVPMAWLPSLYPLVRGSPAHDVGTSFVYVARAFQPLGVAIASHPRGSSVSTSQVQRPAEGSAWRMRSSFGVPGTNTARYVGLTESDSSAAVSSPVVVELAGPVLVSAAEPSERSESLSSPAGSPEEHAPETIRMPRARTRDEAIMATNIRVSPKHRKPRAGGS